MQETPVQFLVQEDRLPTPIFVGFPGGSDGKEFASSVETWVQSLGWETPLEESMAPHSSILAWRIPTDREAWRTTVRGVAKSQMQLSTV